MRALHRRRAQLGQAEREVLAPVIERRCRPGACHHVERFNHALTRVVASQPKADELVLVEDRAAADANVEAPLREIIEQRQLRRQPHRMTQRHLDDGEADADTLRAHG